MATAEPRALFLFPDEAPQPDWEVCSGRYRDWLDGAACPYADDGRMPLRGDAEDDYPCVVERLGRLGDWRGQAELRFLPALGWLTLFKCKQMFLLVIPGQTGG